MNVTPLVSILPVLRDNYSYLLCEPLLKRVLVIDASQSEPVLQGLKSLGTGWSLQGILTTHHHHDHSGGNLDLIHKFPGLEVYGGDVRIPGLNVTVEHDQIIDFGSFKIKSIATPCHTRGSISYFIDSNPPMVFTGDTLFKGGCGRFFEGNASDMYNSTRKLGSLPDNTLVYPGHEYTLQNLYFAKTVDPNNEMIDQEIMKCKGLSITIPSNIQLEKEINPFMRVDVLKDGLGIDNSVKVMGHIRSLKDSWVG